MNVWYRYEDVRYSAGVDEYGDVIRGPGRVVVYLREYEVIKETPRGVWIRAGWKDKRFVRREATKRFACPTQEEAATSFRARKKAQIRIYRARADIAERALIAFDGPFAREAA